MRKCPSQNGEESFQRCLQYQLHNSSGQLLQLTCMFPDWTTLKQAGVCHISRKSYAWQSPETSATSTWVFANFRCSDHYCSDSPISSRAVAPDLPTRMSSSNSSYRKEKVIKQTHFVGLDWEKKMRKQELKLCVYILWHLGIQRDASSFENHCSREVRESKSITKNRQRSRLLPYMEKLFSRRSKESMM